MKNYAQTDLHCHKNTTNGQARISSVLQSPHSMPLHQPLSRCKPHRRMYRAMAKVTTHKLAATSNVIQMVQLPAPLWEEGGAVGRGFGSLVLIAVHNEE